VKGGKRFIAVVPARSGSKGIPDKNMRTVGGQSLIARAGEVLRDPACAFVDLRLLSTDSERYAEEGRRHGLECPFLRPHVLSQDDSGAVETMQQAWRQAEARFGEGYDVLLIVEPTCPLRVANDIVRTVDILLDNDADSVVTVSLLDTKFHPRKALRIIGERLDFYLPEGAAVKARQSLDPLYYRNGACYAVSKHCLYERQTLFSSRTYPCLIERPLANIDDPLDLAFAEFLLSRLSDRTA
jgi:CMP-N-acetylneuraminic acid synthetase